MTDIPLVSVVTPAYNAEKFITQCHESVAAQSITSWEHIIVDDASSDRTVEVVEALARKDPRVRVCGLETNEGPSNARNAAIKLARGRYIAFLDCDDRWLPNKLEKQLAFMREHDAAFCFTSYKVVDETGVPLQDVRVPRHLNYQQFLRGSIIGCLTVIYDREKLGLRLMPPGRSREDYALWLSILKEGHVGHGLDAPLAIYCRRRNSLSGNWPKMLVHNWRALKIADDRDSVTAAFLSLRLAYFGLRKRFRNRA